VLGWCLPDNLDGYATLHGQLIAGVALDELFHGARLRTVVQHAELFRAAGLPGPVAIPLQSGRDAPGCAPRRVTGSRPPAPTGRGTDRPPSRGAAARALGNR